MRHAAFAVAGLCLSACSVYENEVEKGYERAGFTVPAAFTTGDVRIITERRHPILGTPIVCTEPSPDIAKAVSAAASLTAQGGNGSAWGALSLSGASAEAVAELAGRSTALLGLRDGLYRACEAYANGAIGADAYALVLSRYGQLMTTLFLGQDIASATVKGAAIQSPPVTLNVNAPGNNVASTTTQQKSGDGGGGSGGSGGGGANAPQNVITAGATTTPQQGSTEPKPLTETAVLALARMNQDYMNLDYNFAHMLAVTCINGYDLTRLHGLARDPPSSPDGKYVKNYEYNQWLKKVCNGVIDDAEQYVNAAGSLVDKNVLAPPINPVPVPASAAKSAATGTAKKPSGK